MMEFGVNRLVFSSSATVYGQPQYLPVDESHPVGQYINLSIHLVTSKTVYLNTFLLMKVILQVSTSIYLSIYTTIWYLVISATVYGQPQYIPVDESHPVGQYIPLSIYLVTVYGQPQYLLYTVSHFIDSFPATFCCSPINLSSQLSIFLSFYLTIYLTRYLCIYLSRVNAS